jgi:hypothetical protein
MAALTLLIIRHAEKPKESWPGPGLTVDGVPDDKSLVIRGWQRAGAWAALFSHGRGGDDFPKPDVIYAADPHAPAPSGVTVGDDGAPSKRPYETVIPLAARLKTTIDTTFAEGQEAALVKAVTKLDGVVLVAWEHKHIIDPMLGLIAGGQTGLALPVKWPGDRFDVALRFDRSGDSKPWKFRQLFPKLLSGDSEEPLPTE